MTKILGFIGAWSLTGVVGGILKLFSVVSLPWWVVLIPIWSTIGTAFLIILFGVIAAMVSAYFFHRG